MKVILATSNKGKIEEMTPLVHEFFPGVNEIIAIAPNAEETATTFLGNAAIKAEALLPLCKREADPQPLLILADDSGLEVDALGGRPGIHSARYAGDHVEATENVKKLLVELKNIPREKRTCRYVCALYGILCFSNAQPAAAIEAQGFCTGEILTEPHGSGGFGYDPVFYSLDLSCRMSEATLEDKNCVSHRRRAFEKFAKKFKM